MAGGPSGGDDDLIVGINVTPLVDVTLVLLIIFIVTARIIVTQSLPMDLPKAATGSETQTVFSIDLGATGEVAVDSKRVPNEEAILPLAREAHAKNPEVRAVIRADTAVPHGRVIRAMDLLKQAGVAKVAFGVSQTSLEPGGGAAPAGSKLDSSPFLTLHRSTTVMTQATLDPRPSSRALHHDAAHWLSPAVLGAMLMSASVHAVPVIQALRDLNDVRAFVSQARASVHDFLWTEYEVIAPPPPPKAVEEKPKEPEPEPEAPPPPPKPVAQPVTKAEPKEAAKPAEPPPAAAQAGKTLTAPEEAPADFSNDFTMTQGDSAKYAGGTTASKGTSADAVRDPNARGDGVPGGKGSASVPSAPPPSSEPDRSRPAKPSNSGWNCPFPPEADSEGVDSAVVSIMVTVRADGSVQSVKVVSDPGTGFGRAARQCALGQPFQAAWDRGGQAIVGTTAPFNVRFTR